MIAGSIVGNPAAFGGARRVTLDGVPSLANQSASSIPSGLDDENAVLTVADLRHCIETTLSSMSNIGPQALAVNGTDFDAEAYMAHLDAKIRSAGTGTDLNTLCFYRQILKMYMDTLHSEVPFSRNNVDGVALRWIKYLSEEATTLGGSTKKNYLKAMSDFLYRLGWNVAPKTKTLIRRVTATFTAEAKADRDRNGGSSCFISIHDADVRHLLNSLILRYDWNIPTPELQRIHRLMINNRVGRRSAEIESIACSSWKLQIQKAKECPDDKSLWIYFSLGTSR